MKKLIILILIFFINNYHCQSQIGENEYPLGTLSYEAPNGAYIKDVFNEYDKYVGTWEGTLNNKKFTLVIEKKEHQLVTFYDDVNYKDVLVAKYQWLDLSTQTLLYSTMNVVSFEDYKITSTGKPRNNELYFFYSDEFCGNTIEIDIKLSNNDTTMKFFGYYGTASEGFDPTNCPYTRKIDIPVPFPMNGITLNKL